MNARASLFALLIAGACAPAFAQTTCIWRRYYPPNQNPGKFPKVEKPATLKSIELSKVSVFPRSTELLESLDPAFVRVCGMGFGVSSTVHVTLDDGGTVAQALGVKQCVDILAAKVVLTHGCSEVGECREVDVWRRGCTPPRVVAIGTTRLHLYGIVENDLGHLSREKTTTRVLRSEGWRRIFLGVQPKQIEACTSASAGVLEFGISSSPDGPPDKVITMGSSCVYGTGLGVWVRRVSGSDSVPAIVQHRIVK